MKKRRISKQASVRRILLLLREGIATAEIVKEMTSKYEMHDATVYEHLKDAREQYNVELVTEQRELERLRLEEVKKYAKRGLKSKLERDLEMQERIQYYQDILDGNVKVSFILGRKIEENKDLPIDVVLMIQKAITDLWKELGKRLGEYEPNKVEHTGEVKINPIFYLDDK